MKLIIRWSMKQGLLLYWNNRSHWPRATTKWGPPNFTHLVFFCNEVPIFGKPKHFSFQRGWLLFTHWRTMVSRRNEKALRKSNELFLHLIAIEKQHRFVFINYDTVKADTVPLSWSRIPVLLSVYVWPASKGKSVMGWVPAHYIHKQQALSVFCNMQYCDGGWVVVVVSSQLYGVVVVVGLWQ